MTRPRIRLLSVALLAGLLVATLVAVLGETGAPPAAEGPGGPVAGAPAPLQADGNAPTAGGGASGPGGTDRARIAEPQGVTIRGHLRSGPRVAIAGARILAYPGQPTDTRGSLAAVMGRLFGGPPAAAPRGLALDLDGEPLARAEVGADGTFVLTGVLRRHVRLVLEHDFYGLQRTWPVHVPDGRTEVTIGSLDTYLGAHVIGRLVGPGQGEGLTVNVAAEPDPMAPVRDPEGFLSMVLRTGSLETAPDSGGRFEFRALWPSPRVRLMVRSGDYCGRTEVFSLAPGEKRELLLGTQPALQLRAMVVDQDREPVADARVVAFPAGLQGNATRGVFRVQERTGEDGACTLTGLWPGPHRLEAVAAGYRVAVRELDLRQGDGGEQAVELVVDRGGTVTGVVLDAGGEPVAGARVGHMPRVELPMLGDLAEVMGRRPASETSFPTDDEGRFEVSGLADEGEFHLVAVHEDFAPGRVSGVHMGERDVEIRLARNARVLGRVVAAETGEPLPDFTVEHLVSMMMVMEWPSRTETVRDAADGIFELSGIAPGNVRIRIRAEGRAEADRRLQVEAGAAHDVGRIELVRAASIRGRVLDGRGRPVSGATVRRKTGGLGDNPILASFSGGRRARTDDEGNFELPGVSPGRLILLARAEGYAAGQSERLVIEAGQQLDDVTIRLGDGGSISGRLLLPPGEDPYDWQIIPSRLPSGAAGGASPQADGSFRFDHLDPGRYEVQAFNLSVMTELEDNRGQGFRPGQGVDLGDVFEAINDGVVRVRCTVKADEVTEIVLDASELGSPGITLEATVRLGGAVLENGWAELRAVDGTATAIGVIDQGAMRVHGLRPGSLQVQVRSGITYTPVGEPAILEIPDGADVHRTTLELPGGEIHGLVMDDVSGEAVAGTMVRLVREGANVDADDLFGFALTDEAGRFRFRGLAEGTYGVVAGGQLSATDASRPGTSRLGGIEVRGSSVVEGLLLRARPGAGVTVRVTDELGNPQAGALILAVDDDGSPIGGMGLTFTGPDGRGEFGGLPAGPVRIVGRASGKAPGATDVREVAAGEQLQITLRLGGGPVVTLRVTDAQGETLHGAELSARTQDSPWFPATLLVQERGPDGTLGIGPVPPGTWQFRVSHPDTGTFLVTREIPQAERASLILSPR